VASITPPAVCVSVAWLIVIPPAGIRPVAARVSVPEDCVQPLTTVPPE